jgi:N-acylglucosamine-6-phosphate 2-epimerase
MAYAAKVGGAKGIRANTKEDIAEIQKTTGLPVIGIVKRDYEDSAVYITPTMEEVEELMEVKPEIIALDATGAARPDGVTLEAFFHQIKEKYPEQLLMADCSTVEEALFADKLGFDFIGTTMVGYTPQSKELKIETNDFEIIREILSKATHPVIAEGNINTPQKAKRVIELGCYSVVVGSIITRPQLITKSFVDAIDELGKERE